MKKNKLAESWDKIKLNRESDKRILDELIQINSNGKKRVECPKRHFRQKAFITVVAGIVLFLIVGSVSVAAYAHLFSSGKLFFYKANKSSDKNTDVEFVLDDTTRVDTKDLKGKVMECESVIKQQIEDDDPLSSLSPYAVDKKFDDISEAIAYIGYDKLVWPIMDEVIDSVNLSVEGTEEGKIKELVLTSCYEEMGSISAQTEARIFTENYCGEIGVGATSYSDDFPGVDYSGETVITNGREFWVVDSTEFEDGWLGKMVYWQENKVVYTFDIRYRKGDENKVTELVTRWMNGF